MRKIILSRGRSQRLMTHEILMDPILVVPESEVKDYEKYDLETIGIPDNREGLSQVRNWILDKFGGPVIMFDDDITNIIILTDISPKHTTDRGYIEEILQNTYQNAKEAGANIFGFSQKCDVRKYRANNPFLLSTWVGGVIGIIEPKYRFDENNRLKVDVDYCLQSLLRDRIVWVEERFGFIQVRDRNIGGSSIFRSRERMRKEMEYLKNKWGKYIELRFTKTKESVRLNVDRRQNISI